MAAPLTPRVDALEAKVDRLIELVTLMSRAQAPAKAEPVKPVESKSPFIEALTSAYAARMADGEHKPCGNCGRPVHKTRATKRAGKVVCKTCLNATPAKFAERAK